MSKRLLTEMTDEELMEFESLLIRAEDVLKQRKPMPDEELDALAYENGSGDPLSLFFDAWRMAEKYHGIGGSDE